MPHASGIRTRAHSTTTRTVLEEELCPPLSCRASSLMAFLLRFAAGGLAGGGGLLLVLLFPSGLHVEPRVNGPDKSRLATKPTASTPTIMYRERVYRSAPVRPAAIW